MKIHKLGLSTALLRKDREVALFCYKNLQASYSYLDAYLNFCALELFGTFLSGSEDQKLTYMLNTEPNLDHLAKVIMLIDSTYIKVDTNASEYRTTLSELAIQQECIGKADDLTVRSIELPWWVYTSTTHMGKIALSRAMAQQEITSEQANVFCFCFWDYFSSCEAFKTQPVWGALVSNMCEEVLGMDLDWAYSVWSNYMEPEIISFIGGLRGID